jgi:ribosomal protein S18 acetylase RimI-like enzyme
MDRVAMPRFAVQSDATQLAKLRWSSRNADEQARMDSQEFARRFSTWLVDALASDTWHAAVAPGEGSSVVGCMYLQCVGTVPVPGILNRRWGYVTHAFVDPAYRNRGLGRAMLDLLITRARKLELLELHVWPSSHAVSLYTRAGFLSPEQLRALPDPDEPSFVLPLG